jgi:hypothetical protein
LLLLLLLLSLHAHTVRLPKEKLGKIKLHAAVHGAIDLWHAYASVLMKKSFVCIILNQHLDAALHNHVCDRRLGTWQQIVLKAVILICLLIAVSEQFAVL